MQLQRSEKNEKFSALGLEDIDWVDVPKYWEYGFGFMIPIRRIPR
jgi:hypothetical protein